MELTPPASRVLRKRNRKIPKQEIKTESFEDESLDDFYDNDSSFACSQCSKSFLTKKLLKKHEAKHHPKKHVCKVCEKVLTSKVSLQQHMSVHSEEKNFMCEDCGHFFRLKRFLRRHRVSHMPKIYNCDMCKKSFALTSQLKSHQKTHEKNNERLCDQKLDSSEGGNECDGVEGECGKITSSSHETENNSSGTHNRVLDKKSLSIKKQYKCDQCEKFLGSNSSLRVHMKSVHSDVKKFNCLLCDRAFARKNYLQLHMAVHTGEKNYECDECGRSYTQRSSLNTHMKSHKYVPKCLLCKRIFKTNELLEQHLEEHQQLCETLPSQEQLLGQVGFIASTSLECHLCGKTYATKSSLTTHLQSVHSDVKKFMCSECDKTFARKCYLDVHMATHTGEKKYTCDECGKSFAQRSTLNTHKNLHTSTHKCTECGKTFGRKSFLAQHLRHVHKIAEKVQEPVNVEVDVEINMNKGEDDECMSECVITGL